MTEVKGKMVVVMVDVVNLKVDEEARRVGFGDVCLGNGDVVINDFGDEGCGVEGLALENQGDKVR